jgi:hypothetical protein
MFNVGNSLIDRPWIQVGNGGEPAADPHVLQPHGGRGAVVVTDRTFAWIPPETTRRRRIGARLVAAIGGMLLTAPARPRQPSAPSPGTRAAMETARMSREMDRL